MISRQKLLEAAIRVFAESGFRGATTRRIAEEADVNEVTLFRLFKSKTALINEAAQFHANLRSEIVLPPLPSDPHRELESWCGAQLAFLTNSRAVIRKCMAEMEEHPAMAECMRYGPPHAHMQLRRYARALCRRYGLDYRGDLVEVACAMLMGALFADAMGREVMPEMFPQPARRAAALYARCFLRAIGVTAKRVRVSGNGRRPGRTRRAASA
jgi:AcrR family transcriptional regulator